MSNIRATRAKIGSVGRKAKVKRAKLKIGKAASFLSIRKLGKAKKAEVKGN